MELLLLVVAVFALAVLAPTLHRFLGKAAPWAFAVVPFAVTVLLARRIPDVARGAGISESHNWMPALDVALAFRLDGLGLLFALLVSGIGTLIVLYAGGYLEGDPRRGRFYLYLLLFMGSMLGVVLADDLIALFVFWEMTSLSSYLLIGYDHEKADSRRAALQALLVTGGGGLALLAGLVLLAAVTGTYSLQGVVQAGDAVRADALYLPVLLLVLLGAFTKSAQFPFHFWLPNAMAAPTPVSAYLHSATMVKLGVYLLARLHPTLGGTDAWLWLVVPVGAITMLLGAVMALRHNDLKLLLAYSTVSALGAMVMLLGIGTKYAVLGAVAVLLGHAMYKGALFLVAGAVDHATGTRDVSRLGGLRRAMPVTATAAMLAAAAFIGLPPFFNFVAKEALLEAVVHDGGALMTAAAIAAVVALALLVVVAGRVALKPFIGAPTTTPRAPHEPGVLLLAGPVLLAAGGLAVGLMPGAVGTWLVGPAADAVAGRALHAKLALWHGLNLPLLLSALVLATGALLYARQDRALAWTSRLGRLDRFGPDHGYDRGLGALLAGARAQSRVWQNGHLRVYLAVLAGVTAVLGLVTLFASGGMVWTGPAWDVKVHEALLVGVLVAAAFTVVAMPSRLGAAVFLGVVGYAVATVFILFSAPDLAMTQFLFETLSVLLFVMVLWGMPKLTPRSSTPARARDAVLAGSVGLLMTLLVLAATSVHVTDRVSAFHAAQSYVAAHGRNVVNVILVDFRALDTLGEITVLAVAALGVTALLGLPLKGGKA